MSELEELRAAVERLTGERDLAREECGHEKAMRKHLRDELSLWIRMKKKAADQALELGYELVAVEAQNERLRSALLRTERNFRLAVNGKPVRDMDENLAENAAALGSRPTDGGVS